MPNQRNKDKRMTGAYVWEKDLKTLQKIARDNGVTEASVIRAMIEGLSDLEEKALNKIVDNAKRQE